MAIAMAKMAQRALEFERQTSLDFIGYDYYREEKKGLLGAELLVRDLDKMEQYRLTTATRKKEIEKTISLASVAPVAFQRFRETGMMDFTTLPQWFEQDFPGHYLRLIRDVRVSVVALVPPQRGIHATLSNDGFSQVMVGPPFNSRTIIYRLPESVALSSPHNATGLFELRPDDPMLFPFEGSGVVTNWQLEMSKGANRFDFDTIADVFITVRYTALEDREYRKKVLTHMGMDEDGYVARRNVRYMNLRTDFPDQWYHLHHPNLKSGDKDTYQDPLDLSQCRKESANKKPLPPYTMVMELNKSDFLPNEDFRKIKKSNSLSRSPMNGNMNTFRFRNCLFLSEAISVVRLVTILLSLQTKQWEKPTYLMVDRRMGCG